MASGSQTIRRLGPGDEAVVRRLAEREPRPELLADPHVVFVAAFDGDEPVGFAFGYEFTNAVSRSVSSSCITEPDNVAANATYRSLGGRRSDAVLWEW